MKTLIKNLFAVAFCAMISVTAQATTFEQVKNLPFVQVQNMYESGGLEGRILNQYMDFHFIRTVRDVSGNPIHTQQTSGIRTPKQVLLTETNAQLGAIKTDLQARANLAFAREVQLCEAANVKLEFTAINEKIAFVNDNIEHLRLGRDGYAAAAIVARKHINTGDNYLGVGLSPTGRKPAISKDTQTGTEHLFIGLGVLDNSVPQMNQLSTAIMELGLQKLMPLKEILYQNLLGIGDAADRNTGVEAFCKKAHANILDISAEMDAATQMIMHQNRHLLN